MVVNASNRAKIIGWIEAKLCGRTDVDVNDVTEDFAMIAVQGPKAGRNSRPLDLARHTQPEVLPRSSPGHVRQQLVIVSRTGYTGEDGVEVILPANEAWSFWETVFETSRPDGAMACGLGSRDRLRLEAAMPLYGHELSEDITPWQAGSDLPSIQGRTFPGRESLCKLNR